MTIRQETHLIRGTDEELYTGFLSSWNFLSSIFVNPYFLTLNICKTESSRIRSSGKAQISDCFLPHFPEWRTFYTKDNIFRTIQFKVGQFDWSCNSQANEKDSVSRLTAWPSKPWSYSRKHCRIQALFSHQNKLKMKLTVQSGCSLWQLSKRLCECWCASGRW